jgi:hypothetical protein
MANKDRKKPNYSGRLKSRQIIRGILSNCRFSEARFTNRWQPENNISYCSELIKLELRYLDGTKGNFGI